MANVAQLGGYGDTSGGGLMFRNKLINGGFDIWQRGTSQTSSGYGSDDRWGNENVGSTKTASRQTFTLGQTDVPGNPKYWARTVVASVASASNYCDKIQRIESVHTLAGQTCTVSFWAKADASKNMAVELVQWFGTGGGASTAVTGIGVTTIALTTSWQRFTMTVNVPSISGKVIGTSGDDHLALIFWFDAGSTFNARTNSLGQQSGTFDIANVQLESGPQATPFEQRPIGTELALCQRYYERWQASDAYAQFVPFVAGSTTTGVGFYFYKQDKRIANLLLTTGGALQAGGGTFTSLSLRSDGRSTAVASLDIVGSGWITFYSYWLRSNNNTGTYVGFDAEL